VERVLAIDIGGTKFGAGLVDEDGSLTTRRQVPTPPGGTADQLERALRSLVESALADGPRPVALGVGTAGPMTPNGEEVSPLNIVGWRAYPLRARLAELTGLPVFIDGDAKALALGEGWRGAAAGCANFVAMVVSTGVGGGIVLDGRLLDGDGGNAGHIGQMIVVPHGFELEGHVPGVLEAEASGTAILAKTGRPAQEATPEVIEATGRLVGQAVGSLANLLDLQLAVIAGSVALGFGEPFFAAAQDECDAIAQLDYSKGTRIVPALLGRDGPLVGAGAVGWRALGLDIGLS
jgi:glucokinase